MTEKDERVKGLLEEAHQNLQRVCVSLGGNARDNLYTAKSVGRVILALTDTLDLLLGEPGYPLVSRAEQIRKLIADQTMDNWAAWYGVVLTATERRQIERLWVILEPLKPWSDAFLFWMRGAIPDPVPAPPLPPSEPPSENHRLYLCMDCGKNYWHEKGTPKCDHCGSDHYFIPVHEKEV